MLLVSIVYILISLFCIIGICRRSFPFKIKLGWIALVIFLPFGAFLYFFAVRPPMRKWAVSVYVVLVSAFLGLYFSGFRWYAVPSQSMVPTINSGGHVIGRIDAAYRKRMARSDLVIYRNDLGGMEGIFVSRVVGVPGDHVVIHDGRLSVNGEFIRRMPAMPEKDPNPKECDVKLKQDEFFVLGDNPAVSLDSRMLGPIPLDDLRGYLVFRK